MDVLRCFLRIVVMVTIFISVPVDGNTENGSLEGKERVASIEAKLII
jgi:hypothetical protein